MKKIISVLSLVLCLCMLMSLCACNRGGGDSTPDEASTSGSSSVADTTAVTEDTSASTEETTAATETTAPTTTESATVAQVTDAPVVVNPNGQEIYGAGSKSQPYLETPGTDMSVKTVSIPAGKALYYDIYRVGGKYMVIYSSDAYIIYNGTRYNSSGGSVSLVVGDALASEAVSFQIGNAGSTAQSFTIYFSDLVGSYNNPETITKLDGKTITTKLSAGNSTGYHYKYNSDKTGTIRIYVENEPETFLLSATRIKNSDGMLIPIQKSFTDDALSDSKGNYIELEVTKGEDFIISLSAYPKGAMYPAATIKWFAEFV